MDYNKIIIEKYKCFNDVEISGIKNINIIIGKNNIGKSNILKDVGYKNGLYLNENVVVAESWTIEKIKARTEKLVKEVVDELDMKKR